ncbi:sigma 54-interacting transcriptional regulator [Xanthobacter autotrophicus]|uniref:HTH-type transcriptional regulatory protein TyrR n=1 Tax=Xanthobacter dioxanivorans TaxID=2528964 RepID=A0A974PVY4_9HYPH|nr:MULTISPECIES: sigma 54-interacting transcriptional regulator [Xanthobacter]QRG10160.1 sigma 54-interacting transcriptional regulator [Xanthobacter dioxanivorans]UDQ88597.1 sigma 54-interacting transcriptional regulator [Xanthobacter autotrophicus]
MGRTRATRDTPQPPPLSERDFGEIVRNSFDGIFVADGEGRTLLVNPGCERNYDIRAADVVGRPVSDLEADGIIRPVIAPRVIASGERVTAIQRTHKGKTIFATGIPLFDEAGRVRRVIINSRDTTELDQLQAELSRIRGDLARAQTEVAQLREEGQGAGGPVVHGETTRRIADLLRRVAGSDATVLLTGESGVGKEVFARFVHRESARSKAPFIKINCGALPRDLIESELFGYEAGAFTGAQRGGKPGMIEMANTGTLFLDEIGELPLDMQVKLLHVLQDRIIARLGATRSIPLDIRVVAATNRDLAKAVETGAFRGDLFYRLNVVPVVVPPLRERRDDILPLLRQALASFNAQYCTAKQLSHAAARTLVAHDWPGNIRELRNMVERLVVTVSHDVIDVGDLAIPAAAPRGAGGASLEEQVRRFEMALIEDALRRCITTRAAARDLRVSQSTIVRKLKGGGFAA